MATVAAIVPYQDRPGPLLRLASSLCYALEVAVDVASGARRTGPQNPYLNGNFAPVGDERFDADLEVIEGTLPAAIDGAFLRTGPNPWTAPTGEYHWFDGDGMIHCVRIKDGKATYCNRFVETAKLQHERHVGFPSHPKFGDYRGKWGLVHILLKTLKEKLGVIGPAEMGRGTANTALVYQAQRLYALHEGDLPYALRIACEGLISSLGRVTFDGRMGHAFTAHPKVDPATGELFGFGYGVDRQPYLSYFQLDKEGELVRDFGVPIPQPIMAHDFALTEDYVIFLDVPLIFKPEMMVKKGSVPFHFDKTRPTRFGVLPRYASDASAIRWFEAPGEGFMIFHVSNAWQEGSLVKLYVCAFKEFSLDSFTAACDDDALPHVTEVAMDLASGAISVRRVAEVAGDFPVVPQHLIGRKTRYTYMGHMRNNARGIPEFVGIAKIDLQEKDPAKAVAGLVEFGPRRYGGEAFFAPGGEDEDDGFLMTYVYDEDGDSSELVVYNARTMADKPVARVRMPRRIPFGFHCFWMSEEQLQAQAAAELKPAPARGKSARGGLMPRGGLGTLLGAGAQE